MFTEQLGNHMRLGNAARLAIAVELLAQMRRKADGEGHDVRGTKSVYYDNTPNRQSVEEPDMNHRRKLRKEALPRLNQVAILFDASVGGTSLFRKT